MIAKIPPPKLKLNDELLLDWLNALRDWAVQGSIQFLGPGLAGMPSPNGWSVGLAAVTAASEPFLCVTDGIISACSAFSGSTATAGSGTVFVCSVSGTTITKTSQTLSVLNFSTTTGGIATGVNVWVSAEPTSGQYFIV